jgi:hypothetical protein
LVIRLRRGQEQIRKIEQALFVFCVQDFRSEQRIQFGVDVRVLTESQNNLHQTSAYTQDNQFFQFGWLIRVLLEQSPYMLCFWIKLKIPCSDKRLRAPPDTQNKWLVIEKTRLVNCITIIERIH